MKWFDPDPGREPGGPAGAPLFASGIRVEPFHPPFPRGLPGAAALDRGGSGWLRRPTRGPLDRVRDPGRTISSTKFMVDEMVRPGSRTRIRGPRGRRRSHPEPPLSLSLSLSVSLSRPPRGPLIRVRDPGGPAWAAGAIRSRPCRARRPRGGPAEMVDEMVRPGSRTRTRGPRGGRRSHPEPPLSSAAAPGSPASPNPPEPGRALPIPTEPGRFP